MTYGELLQVNLALAQMLNQRTTLHGIMARLWPNDIVLTYRVTLP